MNLPGTPWIARIVSVMMSETKSASLLRHPSFPPLNVDHPVTGSATSVGVESPPSLSRIFHYIRSGAVFMLSVENIGAVN
jgi:hypothetical protein